jgi:hypothetical protein
MNVKIGDKRWVWHFDELKEIEIIGTFEMSGGFFIEERGFAYHEFYENRHEAIEARLLLLAAKARKLGEIGTNSFYFEVLFDEWLELSRSTELALREKSSV